MPLDNGFLILIKKNQKRTSGSLKFLGGDEGDRTPDLLTASQALSQLSYAPKQQRLLYLYIEKDCKNFFSCFENPTSSEKVPCKHRDSISYKKIRTPEERVRKLVRRWACRDSNPEPRDYESPALTVAPQAHVTPCMKKASELNRRPSESWVETRGIEPLTS